MELNLTAVFISVVLEQEAYLFDNESMRKFFCLLLFSLFFINCNNVKTQELDYTVTVYFPDGESLKSSGSENEDYVKGHCAAIAWELFCTKYYQTSEEKIKKEKEKNSFIRQCWGGEHLRLLMTQRLLQLSAKLTNRIVMP